MQKYFHVIGLLLIVCPPLLCQPASAAERSKTIYVYEDGIPTAHEVDPGFDFYVVDRADITRDNAELLKKALLCQGGSFALGYGYGDEDSKSANGELYGRRPIGPNLDHFKWERADNPDSVTQLNGQYFGPGANYLDVSRAAARGNLEGRYFNRSGYQFGIFGDNINFDPGIQNFTQGRRTHRMANLTYRQGSMDGGSWTINATHYKVDEDNVNVAQARDVELTRLGVDFRSVHHGMVNTGGVFGGNYKSKYGYMDNDFSFEPAIYCYHCEYCFSGRHNVCAKLRFLSMPGDPGFFREYVNLPISNLQALPPNLGVNEGALIEPLAVALHSMTIGQPKLGETAVVFGAGPIGLLTMAVLKLHGAKRVWAIEPVPARRELARIMGADAVIDPAAVDVVRQILAETANRGVDLVFDCATKAASSQQAIRVARSAGRVVFTGIPSEIELPIPCHVWRRKELTLFQVRRSNHDSALASEILAEDPIRFAPLITHTRPLDQIATAFAQVERYEDGVGKLIVRLN